MKKFNCVPVDSFVEKWKTLRESTGAKVWKKVWKVCITFGSFRYCMVLCEVNLREGQRREKENIYHSNQKKNG